MKFFRKEIILLFEIVLIAILLIVNLNIEESLLEKKRVNAFYQESVVKPVKLIPETISNSKIAQVVQNVTIDTQEPEPTIEADWEPFEKKESYLIAIIGDSMVDTMGGNLEYLKEELEKKYPGVAFVYYNFGIGSQNVKEGLDRWDDDFSHSGRSFQSISTTNPDILIVGSYAYNPFTPHDKNLHWSYLSDMVKKAQDTNAKVYILAEIAPLEDGFGEGVGGVNWPKEKTVEHVIIIADQLENAIGLSGTLGVELIDAYNPSRKEGSRFGKAEYVDGHDGIHPSVEGHKFMAKIIAGKIEAP